MDKPVVNVFPWQDKVRMQHYCPLHPQVVEAIVPILTVSEMMRLFSSSWLSSNGFGTATLD